MILCKPHNNGCNVVCWWCKRIFLPQIRREALWNMLHLRLQKKEDNCKTWLISQCLVMVFWPAAKISAVVSGTGFWAHVCQGNDESRDVWWELKSVKTALARSDVSSSHHLSCSHAFLSGESHTQFQKEVLCKTFHRFWICPLPEHNQNLAPKFAFLLKEG